MTPRRSHDWAPLRFLIKKLKVREGPTVPQQMKGPAGKKHDLPWFHVHEGTPSWSPPNLPTKGCSWILFTEFMHRTTY